jgi:hypothetical protein
MDYDQIKSRYADRLLAWAKFLRNSRKEPQSKRAAILAYVSARSAEDIPKINIAKEYLSHQVIQSLERQIGDNIEAQNNFFSSLERADAEGQTLTLSDLDKATDVMLFVSIQNEGYSIKELYKLRDKIKSSQ